MRSAFDAHPSWTEEATNTSTKELSKAEKALKPLETVGILGKDHPYHIDNITKKWLEKMNDIEMYPSSTDDAVLFLLNRVTDRDPRIFRIEPDAHEFHSQYILTYARKAVYLVAASDSSLTGPHDLEQRRSGVTQFVYPDFTLTDNKRYLVTIEDKLNKVLSEGKRREIIGCTGRFPPYTLQDCKSEETKLAVPLPWQRILIQVLNPQPS